MTRLTISREAPTTLARSWRETLLRISLTSALLPIGVRATMSGSQVTHPLGEYAARKLGYKRIATVSDDFAYGHEHTSGFQRTFEENGGKIVQKLWPPIGTPDYGAYIAQIKPNVDAVYAGFGPTNGQRFLKQYREYGMKLPVLGMVTTTEESSLKSMGDEAREQCRDAGARLGQDFLFVEARNDDGKARHDLSHE